MNMYDVITANGKTFREDQSSLLIAFIVIIIAVDRLLQDNPSAKTIAKLAFFVYAFFYFLFMFSK